MNRILKKFLQRGVDLSPVGVELREDNTNYFCTPKGASVFGWAGIDGIHFCFIRGFGEMVFSVSPMNTSPDYVHPVAENFTDFLRLILACGDVAAVEQAWMWNEAQFEAFLNENPTTQEQQQTLSEISEKMNLLPMEQPWTYIKNLQSSFDYSQIKYTEDYYDNDMTSEAELVAPEWKVYFDGDFWGHRGKDRAADAPYAGNTQQPQKDREKALDEKRGDQAEQARDQKYWPDTLREVILKPDHQRMERSNDHKGHHANNYAFKV